MIDWSNDLVLWNIQALPPLNTWEQSKMKLARRGRRSNFIYSPPLLFYIFCCAANAVLMAFVSGQTTLTQQDIRPLGNTTCLLARSPYRLQQTLVIPKGALLAIEPGVRLEFLPGTGLIVQGALQALVRTNKQCPLQSPLDPQNAPISIMSIQLDWSSNLTDGHDGDWSPIVSMDKVLAS
jgi:hypothetical protein